MARLTVEELQRDTEEIVSWSRSIVDMPLFLWWREPKRRKP